MIKEKWKTVPIKSVYHGLYDGPHATPAPCADGPVFLGIKNVTDDGALDLTDIRHISESEFPRWTKRVNPQPGDIVFTYEATLNRYALVPDGFRGCLGRRMALIRTNPEKIDTRFLHFYFFSKQWREVISNNTLTGATVDRIPLTKFPDFPVTIPDLPTQRKIAGILSAYDDLIENNLRRIKILEEMAQSLYREWFVHFRFPGHESTRFIHSSLGQIPKGWNATLLGEFVDNKSVHLQTGPFGTQLKASHYSHEGTPVINVRNIGFGTLRAEKLEFLPPDKVDELKRHQLRSGDIVFGRKGAVDRHLLVGPVEDGWIQGSDCIRLRVVSGPLTPRFLSIGFREAEHQRWMMNQCSGGATMASLNQDILCRITLAVPPPELISKFDTFSTSAVNQVDLLASKIQTLRRTRDLLLPKLLNPT